MLNAPEIVEALQTLTSTPVVYKTFEGVSHEGQIDFYSSVDILVSPHGAQLSGLPFMPECGAILELLPMSYYIPYFFGTLAFSANLTSSHLYLSDGDPMEEVNQTFMNDSSIAAHAFRKRVRAKSLCPPVSSIVTSVRALIEKWESCCGET